MPPAPQSPPRRILVRGVNWLGDAVMTTPALLRLREKFSDAKITVLCPEKLKDLWLHHPAVDEIIPFTATEGIWKVSRKIRHGRSPEIIHAHAEKFYAGADDPRARFDLALVLPNSPRSALEVFLAGIPRRIGYARPWRNFFLTQSIPSRPGMVKMRKKTETQIRDLVSGKNSPAARPAAIPASAHQLHEYLHLTSVLDASPEPVAPKLVVTAEEIARAKKKFGLDKISRPIFGLNPGAEYGPAKRWPVENFSAAAREIQKQTGCVWILFGGKSDAETTAQIHSSLTNHHSSLDLAGKTDLRELMALLATCRVLLSNDTGPTHVAAALSVPVVVPFGSTSPELTAPGLPGDTRHHLLKSDAPCSPCFLRECPIDFRCMNGIVVERVVEAVLTAVK